MLLKEPTLSISKRIKAHAALKNSKKDHTPKWVDAESWSGDQFSKFFRESMTWYRLEKSARDLKPEVINWMGSNGYTKKQIERFKRTKDFRCSPTMGAIAANLMRGMPAVHKEFNEGRDSKEWLKNSIERVIHAGEFDKSDEEVQNSKTAKVVMPQPTIQDRLRESAGMMSEELDTAIDNWISDPEAFDPKTFKVVNLLRRKGAKAAHARYIKTFFQYGHDEIHLLASGKADEQLREAYSHNSRKNVKKLIEFYEQIMSACDQIAAEAKVLKKPRAKKIKPAEQIVAKLKFAIRDDKLGIVSVPPAGLIGATGAVVYNVKTRKLGYYIAKTSNGLGVKGTSLLEYTDKSMQKTLRKPPEQLKEFKDINTQKRFEVWFDKSVKTTETALNGRFNQDIILLKVYK